jgi:Uma2 family endonuclease
MSTTTIPGKLLTAADLLAMGPDFHGELVRGRLIEMAPASWGHGKRGAKALRVIGNFVAKARQGEVFTAETGFALESDPDTIRAPDVAFVRAARIPTHGDETGFFKGAPDLAVEVLSPNDRHGEVIEKIHSFLRAGAVEVWVIDPAQRAITIHSSAATPRVVREHETLTDSVALPGFSEPVASFFE